MNVFVSAVVWLSVQVAVFSLVGTLAFFLLRRRGPSAAASCAAVVLALTLPLAMLAVSPWPRWEIEMPERDRSGDAAAVVVDSATHQDVTTEATTYEAIGPTGEESDFAATPAEANLLAEWWHRANEWLRQPMPEPVEEEPANTPWMMWVGGLLTAGLAFGVVRLLLGIWAVVRLRRSSRPIDDPSLMELVRRMARDLEAGDVDARETSLLTSAATIGWRRPLVLLPAQWQEWTESELRIVVAHELAHIARRDYLAALVARVAATIHFYQPLVLWLHRQLRVQQELAADSRAAAVAGSRQAYLMTLAEMALRTDGQTYPWAARAFLPGTGLLLKRVAWLKRREGAADRMMGRTMRVALGVVLVGFVVVVAGVRPERNQVSSLAQAAEPEKSSKADDQGRKSEKAEQRRDPVQPTLGQMAERRMRQMARKNEFVPATAKWVFAFNPVNIGGRSKEIRLLANKWIEDTGVASALGVDVNRIEEVLLVKTSMQGEFDRIIIRSLGTDDWENLIDKLQVSPDVSLSEHQLNGKTYYVVTRAPNLAVVGGHLFISDERTLVFAREDEIKTILAGGEKLLEQETFRHFSDGVAVLMVEGKWLRQLGLLQENSDPATIGFRPVIQRMDRLLVSGSLLPSLDGPDKLLISGMLTCDSEEGAEQVERTLEAGRTLVVNIIEQYLKDPAALTGPGARGTDQTATIALNTIAKGLLNEASIRADGENVFVLADTSLDTVKVVANLLPAANANREAVKRNASQNNLKMLALAMHNYHDANKRFPPPVVLGKDGKTKHSWRVVILPYVEGSHVYNQYRFDEPWDSENNKRLIAQVPEVFRSPHDDAGSGNTAYFMVTGKGTFGDSEKGRVMKEITDGLSNTILLVEAKRDIPWTKPEDIEIDSDPEKPLPELGGFQPNGFFNAAFGDGSVRVIDPKVGAEALRAMFSVDGREPAISDGARSELSGSPTDASAKEERAADTDR